MPAAETELIAQLAEMGWACERHGPRLVLTRRDSAPDGVLTRRGRAPDGAGGEPGGGGADIGPVIVWRVSAAEVATRWAAGRVRGNGHLAALSVAEMLEVFDGERGELREGHEGFRVYPL